MLPSHPSPRNGGPGLSRAPRSHPIGQSRQESSSSSYSRDYSSRPTAGLSRTIQSQRSMNNISRSGRDRSEPPPMPSSRFRYNDSSGDYDPPPVSHKESDASSLSTVSTTASYFIDKLRARYESPRTSLEDDHEPSKRGRGQEPRSTRQEHRSSYGGEHLNFDPRNHAHKPLHRRLPRRWICCTRSWLFALGKINFCCGDSWC